MNTYIVTIDYTLDSEIKKHKVIADSPIEAVLQAGAFAARESEGNCDSFTLLLVEQIVDSRRKVWG